MASCYHSQQMSECPSFRTTTQDLDLIFDGLSWLVEERNCSAILLTCHSGKFKSEKLAKLRELLDHHHLPQEDLGLPADEQLILFTAPEMTLLVAALHRKRQLEVRMGFDNRAALRLLASLPRSEQLEPVLDSLSENLINAYPEPALAYRFLLRMLEHQQITQVSDSRMFRLAEQSQDLIYRIQLNPVFRILYISPVVESWMGCSRDELYADARIAFRHIHPGDAGTLQRMMVEDNSKQGVTLVRFLPATGDPVWIEHRWFVDSSTDRNIVVLDGVGRDITRQKRQEEAINEALRAAEENARSKSLFLANMSHEIRTPLNAIIGQVELLKNTPLNSDQSEMLDSVSSAGKILLSHLTDVLDFSRLDAQRVRLQKTRFNLIEALSDSIGVIKDAAREKGLQLIRHYDPNAPHQVLGDKGKFVQVVLNLLSNALKFTDRGSLTLELSCDFEDGKVLAGIKITDTGIGFPAANFNELSLPFSQADPSSTRKREGAGLGLAIVKRLVELMNARISVESTPGHGACFELTFPFDAVGESISWVEQLYSEVQPVLSEAKPVSVSPAFEQAATVEMLLLKRFEILDEASDVRLQLPGEALSDRKDAIVINVPLNPRLFLQSLLGQSLLPSPLKTPSFPPGLSILVVEDNEVNRKVIGRQLSSLDLTQVDFARDGREALEKFHPDRHQVVLMDIQMPVIDGVETMSFIRDTYPGLRTPFVAVTAHALPGDRESYLETGFQGHLSKPVGLEALRKVLGEVLEATRSSPD